MNFTVGTDDGEEIEFECGDTVTSRWVCQEILVGRTYPCFPFADDVRVVIDAGANCGATSVHFARHYPDATVHAFEPASEPRAILERNAKPYPNIVVHGFGLGAADATVPLYKGDGDTILGSVHRRSVNVDESEQVELRHTGAWAAASGIDRIDVLKVDVEGCEVEVLQSVTSLLPTVKVLYVEYDSRRARREIDALLEPTHALYSSLAFLDQGECVYLRNDVSRLDAARAYLHEAMRTAVGGTRGGS
jgi:FkbM family methyltransferase